MADCVGVYVLFDAQKEGRKMIGIYILIGIITYAVLLSCYIDDDRGTLEKYPALVVLLVIAAMSALWPVTWFYAFTQKDKQ